MRSFNPIIKCTDGFEMSVQAHSGSYCQRNTVGDLLTVECGFPTTTPKTAELRNHAELCGTTDYTETVYPYTPVEVVRAELAAHGGIVDGCLPSQPNQSPKSRNPMGHKDLGRFGPRPAVVSPLVVRVYVN